ncbi:hypothetical protein [Aquitalea sp. USM4]|uniref:hypothetical protein n=1 Tax=Aquitalea sp. USM4 TaxID=1590041 RepID=UPI00103B3168|nr:hypothetical protein [Aquitalea sp. USM4]QBJ80510.1 hypothetical protein DKK66_19875 [Aquitalea sp. USM4]
MRHGRIIDAEFVMVGQADRPAQKRKKPTIGQLWYAFCASLLYLAFLAIALPLLGGALFVLYLLVKVAIFG